MQIILLNIQIVGLDTMLPMDPHPKLFYQWIHIQIVILKMQIIGEIYSLMINGNCYHELDYTCTNFIKVLNQRQSFILVDPHLVNGIC
jgi:hypothetical protein